MNTLPEPAPHAHPIRTFMAAAISAAIRDKLAEIQERLKQAGADVGWVAPANIHLTILFLGHVFESQAAALAAATDDLTAVDQPCTLEVCGLGCFGRAQAPRVIWAGLAGSLQPLLALQGAIAAAAKRTGIFPDAKPFNPHLTIGRVRSARNVGALLAALETCRDTAIGTITIDRVLLMKSSLTARGPIYSLLHESRLGRRVRTESGNDSPGFHPGDRSAGGAGDRCI